MSFCTSSILTTTEGRDKVAVSLRCRAWTCDVCSEDRKRQLIAIAQGGEPNRLITLTSRRSQTKDAAHAATNMVRAWRLVRRNYRRAHPNDTLEFLAIFEQTQLGWPHLHVLARSKFIEQRWLSAEMLRLTDSPIVDVRAVTNKRAAARYVSKYIAKAPGKFGTLKRYWHSNAWTTEPYEKQKSKQQWDRQNLTLPRWCDAWREFGWTVSLRSDREAVASPPC